MGEHGLICTPFPIDAGGCGHDCGIQIEVHELDRQAVVVVRIDPVLLDYLKFDSMVAPPVTAGLQYSSGETSRRRWPYRWR